MPHVLVTGGAGYIGSHVVYSLLEAGRDVAVIDNLSTGRFKNLPNEIDFFEGDIRDKTRLEGIFRDLEINQVIHFAAKTSVPESVEEPSRYYENNVEGTRKLLEVSSNQDLDSFILSSSAAVYGIPENIPVSEEAPTEPINPYGRTKLISEWLVEDFGDIADWQYAILRYFNVAGADPKRRTGQSDPDATHLIKVASNVALSEDSVLQIFGTDYPTDDGTCIRDFIHVSDLADLHLEAMDYLEETTENPILNCGYGRGFSVREIAATMDGLLDESLPTEDAPRRPGDPPELISDISRLNQTFDWEPKYDDIEVILETALEWEKKLINETKG